MEPDASLSGGEAACRVRLTQGPPMAAQRQAWGRLWVRLLGHETPPTEHSAPQDPAPGAQAQGTDAPSGERLAGEGRMCDLPLSHGPSPP